MDEDALFREAMGDVAPLKSARTRPAKPREEPTAAQLGRRERALDTATGADDPNCLTLGEVPRRGPRDFLSWKKAGVQNGVFKKLRLGKYTVDARLDLHRHTVREARMALFEFVRASRARGKRTLLILHGRGERSTTPARIKSYVAHWLTQMPEVIAYHSAAREHGGTGGVYALLKKAPRDKETNRERYGQKSDFNAE